MKEYEGRGSTSKEVYEIIKKAGKPISLREVRASTNANPNTIRGAVQRLVKQDLIERVGKGLYKAKR